jgi:hypothetical protein
MRGKMGDEKRFPVGWDATRVDAANFHSLEKSIPTPVITGRLAPFRFYPELKAGGMRRCAGHQDFGTTANTYSHLLEGAQAQAVAKVDELLGRVKKRG